jgi:hypothetical protein
VAVRTNWVANPSHENGAGAWITDHGLPANTLTYPSDGGFSGTRYARRTFTANDNVLEGGLRTSHYDFTPGSDYVYSLYVRVSEAQRLRPQVGAVGVGSTLTGEPVDVLPNVWTRLYIVFTAPVGATEIRFSFRAVSGGFGHMWQIGETLDQDAAMIEEGSVLGTYFDGDTPDSGLITYSWAGTPYASESVTGAVSLPEQDIPEPYGKVFASNSKANMAITYRSGWLG